MNRDDLVTGLIGVAFGAMLMGAVLSIVDSTPRDNCYLKNVNGIYCAVCPNFRTVACLQHKPEWDTEAK